MDPLTWTGALGVVLNPIFQIVVVATAAAIVTYIFASFIAPEPEIRVVNATGAAASGGITAMSGRGVRLGLMVLLVLCLVYLLAGIVTPFGWAGIIGEIGQRFLPVWICLIVTFVLSISFKRSLGLYGKLFDSPIGMVGFGLVMFWVFTAIFSNWIVTHEVLEQISGMKNKVPGTPLRSPEDGQYTHYLLGGDTLARDVFSRMVAGSKTVLLIAPAATAFAFMVGITLGLPAGYYGGKFDTIISFMANLVLAFPVILLFFLLVTPEIREYVLFDFLGNQVTFPKAMAAILFLFPIIFLLVLWNSRYYTQPAKRNVYVAATLIVGGYIYLGLAWDADPSGVISMDPGVLIVFVSVVFVNSPTVFRIVRGLVLDIKTRDYVAAGQTRGEGPWYIMLWEILPNARGPLIVDFCLRIGYTTILLGTLGFFGLGLSPESPDWGTTINQGRKLLSVFPHPAIAPAVALMSLVLGLNLLADGLREESLKD